MRWWYIKYENSDDFKIEDYWEHKAELHDKKLAECDAVWDARSHKERAVRNMFVVDDAEPGEILLRCRGTVQAVAWKIWDASRKERRQRRGF